MLEGHSGSTADLLEADLDLGAVDLVAFVAILEHQAHAWLPDRNASTLDTFVGRGVEHIDLRDAPSLALTDVA